MTTPQPFDPSRFLTLVSGKEYLEVRWRLVWLRSEHPDAVISTELVDQRQDWAMFKATVSIPDGGMATGHGSEDALGFGDFIEKAETKAIGRALAALGYGTQFCGDFDFGAAIGRVVDSPTPLRQSAPQRDSGASRPQAGPGGATEKQIGAIRSMARKLGMSGDPADLNAMTRQEASKMIEDMQAQLTNQVPEAMA